MIRKLGVFTGARGAGSVDGTPPAVDFKAFSDWLGVPVSHALDWFDGGSWGSIEDPGWFLDGWRGRGVEVTFSVPLLPKTGGLMTEGAKGVYNSHFYMMGKTLVSKGFAGAVLRLGWEFNGSWYPWFAGRDPASFRSYWKQIVNTLRAVPGQSFRYDWCPTLGKGHMDNVELAWPGAGYVNRIGTDVYDNTWTAGDAAQRWTTYVSQPFGLKWHASFAALHNKNMSHPEWGLTDNSEPGNPHHGGGDNPLFISNMHSWIRDNRVVSACYFQHDSGDGAHHLDHFPESQKLFKQLFGAAL